MYLYIHIPNGKQADRQGVTVQVSGITLKDGYIPTISGQVLPLKADDGSPLQLEPAIWFKVLVLDSIYVDCTSEKRAIMWNSADMPDTRGFEDSIVSTSSTASRRASKHRKRISESMYQGGEFYGYGSDIDEAFEIARKAACDFTQQMISPMEFYETVLRVLHCYILPSIELTQDDLPKLSEAYNFHEKMVERVDKSIMKVNYKAEEVSNSKWRQRNNFAEELSTLVNSGSRPVYPVEFTKLLYDDIQKDISFSWDSLNDLQTAVDKAKQTLNAHPSSKNEKLLEECRAKRNTGHQNYEKLLKVREILHGMVNTNPIARDKSSKKKSKKSKRKSGSSNSQLTAIYMEMEKTYHGFIETIMRITDEKVLILSVKEAMKQAIADLDKGEETTGLDINSTGLRRPTDVLRKPSMPNLWKTLAEQITTIIVDSNHQLCVKHEQFCKEIIGKCKKAIAILDGSDEAMLLGDSSPENKGMLNSCDLSPAQNVPFDSDSYSLGENAMVKENELYVKMNFRPQAGKDTNKNDIDHCTQSGDASVYEDYDPSSAKNSTLTSLAGEQCASCFGRLSMLDPTLIQEGTYMPQSAAESLVCDQKHFNCVDSLHCSSEDIEIVFSGRNPDEKKDMIIEIKNSIKNHIELMVDLLKTEIHSGRYEQLHRKVWSCYETHFYERVISHLTRFYDAAYRHITNKFCESLSELTVEDLKMENSFILHLLKDKPKSDSESVQFSVGSNPDEPSVTVSSDMVELVPLTSQSHNLPANPCSNTGYIPNILSSRLDELPPVVNPSREDAWDKSEAGATALHSSQVNEHNYNEHNDQSEDSSLRESRVYLRRVSGDGKSGIGRRPDTTVKRFSRYGGRACAGEAVNSKEYHTLMSIQEAHGDDSASTGSTTESGSSESIEKKSSDSSSLAGSQSSMDDKHKDHGIALSQELILFTESYQQAGELRLSVPCSSGVDALLERSTWPRLTDRASGGKDSTGGDEGGKKKPASRHKRPLPPPSSKDHLILQDKYKELSIDVVKCIESVINESSPLTKLQYLTKCLRELSDDIREISEELEGDSDAASADQQLDYLVVFLCNCDANIVSKLYVHVNLLNDIIPSFLESGPFAYALVQFQMAFSFLSDNIVFLSRAVTASSSC